MNIEGIREFESKLKQNEQTQKTYWNLRKGGLEEGKAGRQIYCDTMTSRVNAAKCMGASSYKISPFEKATGTWKRLSH